MIEPFRKFAKTTIDRDDLSQIAHTALHEFMAKEGERERYSGKALKRVRKAVVVALREARSAAGTVSERVTNGYASGSVGEKYRQCRRDSQSVLSPITDFYNTLSGRLTPEALDVLQRLHCYDQGLDEIAGALGLDVIEVGRLAELGAEEMKTVLGDRKFRVLRGRLTGVLDEYEPPEQRKFS